MAEVTDNTQALINALERIEVLEAEIRRRSGLGKREVSDMMKENDRLKAENAKQRELMQAVADEGSKLILVKWYAPLGYAIDAVIEHLNSGEGE